MKNLLLVALACLMVTACAHRRERSTNTVYVVNVDAISASDALAKRSFYIIPGDKATNLDDLQYLEFKRYISYVLGKAGLTESSSIDTSDLVVYLSYGIGEPQTITQTYAAPIFGLTGVSSAHTYGTAGAFGGFSSTTYYTPTWGIVGTTQRTKTTVSYTKSVVVDAYDRAAMQSSNKLLQVWRILATNSNSQGDMRSAFPYLVAAMGNYVGENTYERKPVLMTTNHPAMVALRNSRTRNISRVAQQSVLAPVPATQPAQKLCTFDALGIAHCDQ